MESLLAAVFLWLLVRCLDKPGSPGRIVTAGLGLTAYLLTFVAGSFLVGIVVLWAFYEIARSMWTRAEITFPRWSIAAVLLIPLPFLFPVRHMLWMNHTIAALAAGRGGDAVAPADGHGSASACLARESGSPASTMAAAAIALLLARFAPGWLPDVKLVLVAIHSAPWSGSASLSVKCNR